MAVIDLTQPLHAGIPVAPILPPIKFEPVMRLGTHVANVTMCHFPSHIGTHVDAPSHFFPNGRTIDQVPLEWLRGTASILDLPRGRGEEISGNDLEKAGGDVQRGDLLFVRTGFGGRYVNPGYLEHAHLTEDAARWLVERGVRALGVDMLTPDAPHFLRDRNFAFPVHRLLLGAEVLIIESLNLEQVAGRRLAVEVLPLPIRGGDGSPARAVAYTDRDAWITG